MKIFDWLLSKVTVKPGEEDLTKHWGAPEPRKFGPVPKWTHAGKRGKDIWCPKCSEKTHVFHFGWSSMVCQSCRAIVDKYEWLMPVKEDKL